MEMVLPKKFVEIVKNPDFTLRYTLEALEASVADLGFDVEESDLVERASDRIKYGDVAGSYSLKSGDKVYHVSIENSWKHKHGHGGKSLSSCVLKEGDVKLFERRHYLRWTTYADDSEDFELDNDNFIALYKEDVLARAVFDKVKERCVEVRNG